MPIPKLKLNKIINGQRDYICSVAIGLCGGDPWQILKDAYPWPKLPFPFGAKSGV